MVAGISDRVVYFVSPVGVSGRTVELVCEREGWEYRHLTAPLVVGSEGQRAHLVPRTEAADLYVQLHRTPTAVVHDGKVLVRTAPHDGMRERTWISLRQFCAYKSFVTSTRANGFSKWAESYELWATSIECDGTADPRCFPFHSYSSARTENLESDAMRAAFRRHHYRESARNWLDDDRFTWAPATAQERHGRDPVTIAGCELPLGFHWDLTRRPAKEVRLADSVYRIGQHLNVYPDGKARKASSKLVWSRKDSDRRDQEELRSTFGKRNAPR